MFRRSVNTIAAVLALVLAGACGSGEPPEETVFDPMVDTIERAEEVEDLTEERIDELNERIDSATE